MTKKAQKIAKAAALRPKQGRPHKAGIADWGKAGVPPSPVIVPPRRERRHFLPLRWAFLGDAGEPSPLLLELMASAMTALPLPVGNPILEAGALACRRRKDGSLSILLVGKRRSGKWGVPKGRLNGLRTFGEVAAKEAFEEAGIKGRVSPNSIAVFRAKKRAADREHSQIVEVWVYLIEVTKRLRHWPEKGKREIKWVSCETAARQLREPMLADICHRLAKG
jgi:8-oxo-dGTP pyrophosphatase MutT (NUDIX family)